MSDVRTDAVTGGFVIPDRLAALLGAAKAMVANFEVIIDPVQPASPALSYSNGWADCVAYLAERYYALGATTPHAVEDYARKLEAWHRGQIQTARQPFAQFKVEPGKTYVLCEVIPP